ncbi:hypothetical protein [Nonomuraea gerenzanensis]|uniref:Transfer protein traSA n=1 Tax=Nonomuraea gerenzanensis TaxID=93944 RepID=A0A1M4BKT3_9ACTN|nr:hypothetical protein [Nonomuraea gerenzanensis]UBU19229.1 hypothetical protein LCN96_56365 [Nonomuraea gerenzanensis]SAP16248.1 Transfer protein traSA [Nonomuraea gerenzanensis]
MLNFLFSALGKLLVWLAKQLAKLIALLVTQAVLHPRSSASAGVAAAGVAWLGWQLSLVILGGAFTALSTWKTAHPASFAATVGTWTRTWWHKWWIYRRQWNAVLTACGLSTQVKQVVALPKLRSVRSTPYWDHLVVEMQLGQALGGFVKMSDELRLGFKAQRILMKEARPRLLNVALMQRDPLLETVPASAIPASVEAINWRAVPVGIDEFGDPYTVSLLGGCTSCAGTMGAGKAGLEWNILRAIAPGIAAGLVRPVGIDPKLKELSQARQIFADGDYVGLDTPDLPDATLALLERLVEEMGAANAQDGATGERDFTPRPGRPLTLILIDELAPLLKYWPRRTRDKIEDALGLLLTQGRAAGFIVIGLIQEPTKDVFTLRDLFARRIALRLPTESHTEAALIEKATDYGAACHTIPESLPGLLFSLQEGARSTVRARLGYVTNQDIAELVDYLTPSATVVDLAERKNTVAA